MLGRRAIDTMDIYLGSLGIDVPPEVAIAERDKIFIAAVPDGIQLKPGATDLLNWLEANQIPTALATSGQRHYVDLVLRDVTHPFGARMTAEHVTRERRADRFAKTIAPQVCGEDAAYALDRDALDELDASTVRLRGVA